MNPFFITDKLALWEELASRVGHRDQLIIC